MKALFIGGTGQISMAIVRRLAEDPLWEVWLLNRGNRKECVRSLPVVAKLLLPKQQHHEKDAQAGRYQVTGGRGCCHLRN